MPVSFKQEQEPFSPFIAASKIAKVAWHRPQFMQFLAFCCQEQSTCQATLAIDRYHSISLTKLVMETGF